MEGPEISIINGTRLAILFSSDSGMALIPLASSIIDKSLSLAQIRAAAKLNQDGSTYPFSFVQSLTNESPSPLPFKARLRNLARSLEILASTGGVGSPLTSVDGPPRFLLAFLISLIVLTFSDNQKWLFSRRVHAKKITWTISMNSHIWRQTTFIKREVDTL